MNLTNNLIYLTFQIRGGGASSIMNRRTKIEEVHIKLMDWIVALADWLIVLRSVGFKSGYTGLSIEGNQTEVSLLVWIMRYEVWVFIEYVHRQCYFDTFVQNCNSKRIDFPRVFFSIVSFLKEITKGAGLPSMLFFPALSFLSSCLILIKIRLTSWSLHTEFLPSPIKT